MAKSLKSTRIIEVAWEVCNQVGGIYTVIRSKVPDMKHQWKENYSVIGPYFENNNEFEEEVDEEDSLYQAVKILQSEGIDAHYGTWLISGRPKAVLLNPQSVFNKLDQIKFDLWENHDIKFEQHDELLDQVVAFGYLVYRFNTVLESIKKDKKQTIVHFHEWMAGVAIPMMRKENLPAKIVFTTHATLLGRYLAMNDPNFYERLEWTDWEKEAKYFNVLSQVKIERAATHGAHTFTTVSQITGLECKYLLHREPDELLPNGLNVSRYEALHEFQNLHATYKKKIEEFIRGHFFPSYSFNLDKTLYFFTSGRFEFKNKGFDLTLEALARLNAKIKDAGIDLTVVMFFITKKPTNSINVDLLHSRSILEELRHTCEAIEHKVSERLFDYATTNQSHNIPELSEFIPDYWRLRYKRTLQSWQSQKLPPIVTHNLVDEETDDLMNFMKTLQLFNREEDRVKIVYHPDFVNFTSPLFGMEYGQFVRGCNMGIFPSYYEPWGYTPLECLVRGVPSITSDLSGFGDYVLDKLPKITDNGVYVTKRKGKPFHESAEQLANQMLDFINLSRRDRIQQRNFVESFSEEFDWKTLIEYYKKAYKKALMVD